MHKLGRQGSLCANICGFLTTKMLKSVPSWLVTTILGALTMESSDNQEICYDFSKLLFMIGSHEYNMSNEHTPKLDMKGVLIATQNLNQ